MDIECLQCGKKVYGVTKRRKFCSQRCAHVRRYVLKGRKRGKWVKCGYCRKKMWAYPRHLKKKAQRFCGREHFILFIKEKAICRKCAICGKITNHHRETCSVACRSKLQTIKAKKNRIKNGSTKHQIDRCIRYSSEADRWRKAVFARDDYTCQLCDKRGGYLEAHHRKPFAYFPELRFEISNGQTLCRKCHNKTKKTVAQMRKLYAQPKEKN